MEEHNCMPLLMSFPIYTHDGHYVSRVKTRTGDIVFVCRIRPGKYETLYTRDSIIDRCEIECTEHFDEWWRNAHS